MKEPRIMKNYPWRACTSSHDNKQKQYIKTVFLICLHDILGFLLNALSLVSSYKIRKTKWRMGVIWNL